MTVALWQNPTYYLGDVDTAVSAAGSTQGGATTLPAYHSWVSTVTAGSGVKLPEVSVGGPDFTVVNATSTELRVYPWTGASINGATANLALLVGPNSAAKFKVFSNTKIGATP